MKCRSCKSNLHTGAVRCHECQSWQNWRAHTEVFALVLGVIISLSALYGGLIDPIYNALKTNSPELNVQVLSSKTDEVSAMLANKGDSAAGIKTIYFNFPGEDGFDVPVGREKWGTLLKKGEIISLELSSGDESLPVIADDDHKGLENVFKTDCNFVLEYTAFQQDKLETYKKPYICYSASLIPGAVKSKRFN